MAVDDLATQGARASTAVISTYFFWNGISKDIPYLQVSLFLKDTWINTLRKAIRTSLRDVGKGWFNLHETNWEVYQMSKMKKFMEMVKFNMQVNILIA